MHYIIWDLCNAHWSLHKCIIAFKWHSQRESAETFIAMPRICIGMNTLYHCSGHTIAWNDVTNHWLQYKSLQWWPYSLEWILCIEVNACATMHSTCIKKFKVHCSDKLHWSVNMMHYLKILSIGMKQVCIRCITVHLAFIMVHCSALRMHCSIHVFFGWGWVGRVKVSKKVRENQFVPK